MEQPYRWKIFHHARQHRSCGCGWHFLQSISLLGRGRFFSGETWVNYTIQMKLVELDGLADEAVQTRQGLGILQDQFTICVNLNFSLFL